MAVNHPDRGSSPLRGEWDCGRWLMQRIVNPCFGNGGSSPLNPIQSVAYGCAFDLGSKDCGFESCHSETWVVYGSAGVCKTLSIGSIPIPSYDRWQRG